MNGIQKSHNGEIKAADLVEGTNIHTLFRRFDFQYFGVCAGKLESVEVRWSPKMTLCAGTCHYQFSTGYCSVRLSEPLLKLRPRSDLIDTLLHEMIHAYLFVTHNKLDREDHGPEFLKLMNQINNRADTHITVYHSFHDEVKHYRTHVWRCKGPCRLRPPFYGFVKRAMNRPPQRADPWFFDHLRTCGGQFEKISEPEKTPKTRNDQDHPVASVGSPSKAPRIDDIFHPVNQPDNDVKILSDDPPSRSPVVIDALQPCPLCDELISTKLIESHITKCVTISLGEDEPPHCDDNIELIDLILSQSNLNEVVETCACPLCNVQVDAKSLNIHLEACLASCF